MDSNLIAPCGMNCGVCLGYLREKNKCPGCRNLGLNGFGYCRKCIIRNCDFFKTGKSKFCNKCDKYPCKRLRELDKRYKLKYNMSMLENLKNIDNLGIKKFVSNEKLKWTCSNCGNTICVHRKSCLFCNAERKTENEIV
jgi:hypothetical protein